MYYIAFGRFKELKMKVFADWFMNEENVRKLQEAIPDGARFKGAFLVDEGHADHEWEIWYEIDNYGVLDNWTYDKNPKLKEFGEEIAKTLGVIYKWGRGKFLKPVSDITLLDPEIYKKD